MASVGTDARHKLTQQKIAAIEFISTLCCTEITKYRKKIIPDNDNRMF